MKDFEFVFNPEEIKRKRFNDTYNIFLNDEIQNKLKILNAENKKKKREIFKKQNWTVKNMTYYGLNLPSRWKGNDQNNNKILNVLKKDKEFVDYLKNNDISSNISTSTIASFHQNYKKEDNQNTLYSQFHNNELNINANLPDINLKIKNMENINAMRNRKIQKFHNFRSDSPEEEEKRNNKDSIFEKDNKKTKTVGFNITTSSNFNNFNLLSKSKTLFKNENEIEEDKFKRTSTIFQKTMEYKETFSSNKLLKTIKDMESLIGINQTENLIDTNSKKIIFNSTKNSLSKGSQKVLENFFRRNIKKDEDLLSGNLLNVDYSSLYKRKIDIKNKELRKNWESIDHYGPRYAHCNSCFNLNLNFFEKINPNDGNNIINYIKSNRKFEN